MDSLEFMSEFKPGMLCIKEFQYWIVCVREKHPTLGAAVILLKREISSVGEMLPEEGAEFPSVVSWYENVCAKKFGAVKFNYIIMMLKDHFVHYHAFPRYDKDVFLFKRVFKDVDWPGSINFKAGDFLDSELLLQIRDYMRE